MNDSARTRARYASRRPSYSVSDFAASTRAAAASSGVPAGTVTASSAQSAATAASGAAHGCQRRREIVEAARDRLGDDAELLPRTCRVEVRREARENDAGSPAHP